MMVGMNPEVGGTFQIFDETQIKPIPGVKRIVTLPELYGSTTGIAVVAKSTYLSMKILRQLTVEWCPGKANELSNSHIRNAMDIALDSSSGFTYFSSGDAEQALTESASQVKAEDKPRQRAGSVKFLPGSQESEAARAKRLKRECRGRPNAGACLGHAS